MVFQPVHFLVPGDLLSPIHHLSHNSCCFQKQAFHNGGIILIINIIIIIIIIVIIIIVIIIIITTIIIVFVLFCFFFFVCSFCNRNCFRIFEWFPSPELKRVTREDEPRRIIQKFNKAIAQQFCNKYVTSKWMLSQRLWLKNRSSTILVELPDFPGFYQSAVKLLQKSFVARSHSQANLGNLVRGKEKVSKRK